MGYAGGQGLVTSLVRGLFDSGSTNQSASAGSQLAQAGGRTVRDAAGAAPVGGALPAQENQRLSGNRQARDARSNLRESSAVAAAVEKRRAGKNVGRLADAETLLSGTGLALSTASGAALLSQPSARSAEPLGGGTYLG